MKVQYSDSSWMCILFGAVIFTCPSISSYIHRDSCTNLSKKTFGTSRWSPLNLLRVWTSLKSTWTINNSRSSEFFRTYKVDSSNYHIHNDFFWFQSHTLQISPVASHRVFGHRQCRGAWRRSPTEVFGCLRCLRFRRCLTGRWPSRRARWHAMGAVSVSPRKWVWRHLGGKFLVIFFVYITAGVRCRVSTGVVKNQIIHPKNEKYTPDIVYMIDVLIVFVNCFNFGNSIWINLMYSSISTFFNIAVLFGGLEFQLVIRKPKTLDLQRGGVDPWVMAAARCGEVWVVVSIFFLFTPTWGNGPI